VLSNASDFQDVKPWTTWPGGPSDNNEHLKKAPSIYAYAFENEELETNAWGYEVEPGMISCSWTKLLLDNAAAPSEYDDPYLEKAASNGLMRLPYGKTAKDVATDYMKGLYTTFYTAIESVFGDNRADIPPMEFWVTIPATWSERAKAATRSAAKDAGFGSRPGDRLNLIAEPEAAAHLALKSSIHHVDDLVRVGIKTKKSQIIRADFPIGEYWCSRLRLWRRNSRKSKRRTNLFLINMVRIYRHIVLDKWVLLSEWTKLVLALV
jgi:hypothetical protein